MGGLSATLEISKNTLLNSQVQVQTASHNIANADNKSYARQKAVPVTNPPTQAAEGYLGMGARIDQIMQMRDKFVEKRLMDSTSQESQYTTESSALGNVEAIISDSGDYGISSALSSFWNAWEGLNQNPSGTAEISMVRETTQNLASTIRSTFNAMVEDAQTVEDELGQQVTKANSLISDIAGYNAEIAAAELGGQTANDLRDNRYKALTELAGLIPIKSAEDSTGAVTLTIEDNAGTVTLLSGSQTGSLQYDSTLHALSYTDYQGNTSAHTGLSGGSVQGLINVFTDVGTSHSLNFVLANPDDPSLTYQDRFNAFTATLITNVNTVNSQSGGSDVYDAGVIGSTFKASDIQVDANFQPDASTALDMTDLQDQKLTNLGNTTLGSYLTDIQQRIGTDVQSATSKASFQSALKQQLETEQQAVSGVSIDEEMLNILQFQQVYQAAAKIISTTSQMLDAVIQMV